MISKAQPQVPFACTRFSTLRRHEASIFSKHNLGHFAKMNDPEISDGERDQSKRLFDTGIRMIRDALPENFCSVRTEAARIEIGGSETRCPARCKYCQDYGAISGDWTHGDPSVEPCDCQDFWGIGDVADSDSCEN